MLSVSPKHKHCSKCKTTVTLQNMGAVFPHYGVGPIVLGEMTFLMSPDEEMSRALAKTPRLSKRASEPAKQNITSFTTIIIIIIVISVDLHTRW